MKQLFSSLKKMINTISPRKLLITTAIILFLLPFVIFQNSYVIGGDDTRLYYLYPESFLKNYAFNLSSNNTLAGASTGYNSVAYFAPFFFVIYLIKFIPYINSQLFLYGLNLALGFLGFYLFISYWTNKNTENKNNPQDISIKKVINIIASIGYVTSIYLIKSLYQNQLLSMYLVSILPFVLYFFVKSVEQKKIHLSLIASLIFSIFSTTLNSLPWINGFFICSLPLLIYLLISFPKRTIFSGIFFVISFLLLNIVWIFHLLYPVFNPQNASGTLTQYSNPQFINDNLRILKGVMAIYNPLNVIFYENIQYFDSNYLTLKTFINSILFLVIILAGILIKKNQHQQLKIPFTIFLSSFLLSWFLFSPNFGNLGQSIFIWLGTTIPFFTMFRNMFDKFSHPLAFYFALLLGSSLHIIVSYIKKSAIKKIFLFIILSIFLFNGLKSFNLTQTPEVKATRLSGSFNNDFNDLIHFLNTQNDYGGVLWLPLNSPTYVNIEDGKLPGQFYSGLSPLRSLTNRNDYTGRFSFIDQEDIFKGEKLFKAIETKDFNYVQDILKSRGITYVIVNHQTLPDKLNSFMYGGDKIPLLDIQDNQFLSQILGPKVKDFGNRYSLYYINPQLSNKTIFISKSDQAGLDFIRINNEQYRLSISNLQNGQLNMLIPYNSDWNLYVDSNGTKIPLKNEQQSKVYDYANSWELISEEIKKEIPPNLYQQNPDGSINITLYALFYPSEFNNLLYIISSITAISIIVLVITKYAKKQL